MKSSSSQNTVESLILDWKRPVHGEIIFLMQYVKEAEKVKDTIVQARKALSDGKKLIIKWFSALEDRLIRIFPTESLSQYLVKNITKQELARQFLSDHNVIKKITFLQSIKDMEDSMQQYREFIYDISIMLMGYVKLSSWRPVIINDSSVQRLELIQKALTVNTFSDWAKEGDLWEIIRGIPSVILDGPIRDLNENVMRPILLMSDKYKIVETNLQEYQDSIKMDSQFYL